MFVTPLRLLRRFDYADAFRYAIACSRRAAASYAADYDCPFLRFSVTRYAPDLLPVLRCFDDI